MILVLSCGTLLVSLPGCESRRDRAVIDWVNARPDAVPSGLDPEAAKGRSFDYEAWEQQGRALADAEETIDRLLKSQDTRLDRRKAVDVLCIFGTSASVPVLTEFLRDHDSFVRSQAMQDLQHIGVANHVVFSAIAPRVDGETSSDMRVNAARVLARLFGERTVVTLKYHQQEIDREAKELAEILEDVENGREGPGNRSQAAPEKAEEGK